VSGLSELSILPQVLIDGLTLGFIYAVVAVGYTMVYGILKLVNFAHGEIFMIGAFAGTEVLLALQRFGIVDGVNPYVSLLIAILIASLLSGFIGVGIEYAAYRPIRGVPTLILFITAIGLSFILQDLVRMVVGLAKGTYLVNGVELFSGSFAIGGSAVITEKAIVIIAATLIIMIGMELFVKKSKWGIAIRAVSQDPSTASLMRININKVIALTFFVGSAIGGATGVLYAQYYSTITPYIGFLLGMKALTAAILGGIGNIRGAMLGGVLLGLLESLGTAYIGPLTGGAIGAEYKDVFAFSVLILVLLFKPAGLLGKAVKEKV